MIRRWLREMAEGARILCSRRFWRYARDYYRPAAIAERLDQLAVRLRGLACPCGGDRIGGGGCTCDPPFANEWRV